MDSEEWRVDKGTITFQGIMHSRTDLVVNPEDGDHYRKQMKILTGMKKWELITMLETDIASAYEGIRQKTRIFKWKISKGEE